MNWNQLYIYKKNQELLKLPSLAVVAVDGNGKDVSFSVATFLFEVIISEVTVEFTCKVDV